MKIKLILSLFLILILQTSSAQDFIIEDAERFAAILKENPDLISADIIKAKYLKPGTKGVKIFTPNRIRNAKNMASMVNKYRSSYDKGIDIILPSAKASIDEVNEILANVQQLLGQKESAPVYVLFGGNNSGGTASGKGLVIGLEVLARFAETHEEAKKIVMSFCAHEIVHVYQARTGNGGRGNLLHHSLREGFADFIENMALGEVSNAEKERHEYGQVNEAQLWSEFQEVMDQKELRPWMYDGRNGDRPADLGYWIGKRICEAYYAQAEDKVQALQALLRLENAEEILEGSGYNP
ncbi:MAG: DUF2268 domain-containing putative Zn-dependent protease [Bacteroidia bacterium]